MDKRKALLAVFYNTNTAVVNPTVYLKFLVPFLLVIKNVKPVVFVAYITALYIYNLIYIINDYVDYTSDVQQGRMKVSFIHLYGGNFVPPLIGTLLVVFVGALLLEWKTVIVMAATGAVLGFLHSRFRSLKPVTFLLLRLFRISLPAVLVLPKAPEFKSLLLFSLVVFPIYNLRSYVEYARLKKFSPWGGVIGSILISLISLYFSRGSLEQLALYVCVFAVILAAVKMLSRLLAPKASRFVGSLLLTLGYRDVEKKVEELIVLALYLVALGAAVWLRW